MAIVTKYIYDRIYITDGWANEVIPVGGVVRNLADVIKLDEYMSFTVDGEDNITRFLNDTINLDEYMGYTLGDGLTQYLNDVISLDEYMSYEVALAGVIVRLYDNIDLDEVMIYEVVFAMGFKYNENISFGDTEEPNYKEYSHRFRWTNYNGVAVPDLNFKDLKEPIVRMIPAPSFLQFKYDNSFILFTRNSINRFLLDADVETGQWRAVTDNLIEEFNDFGLMAPKTLCLAADTLFGLSEKGVWKWNKDGMRLISDKVIAIPDAGDFEFTGFYCPIRNQYILHRQDALEENYAINVGTPELNPTTGGAFGSPRSRSVMLTSTKMLTFHSDGSSTGVNHPRYLTISTVDGDAETVVAESILTVTTLSRQDAGYDLIKISETKCLIMWFQTDSTYHVAVVTITGNTCAVSGDTLLAAPTHATYSWQKLYKLNSAGTRFVAFYSDENYVTFTLTGDVIALDVMQVLWVPGGTHHYYVYQNEGCYLEDGKALLVWNVTTGSVLLGLCCAVITDTGSALTFGAVSVLGTAFNFVKCVTVKVIDVDTVLITWADISTNESINMQSFQWSGATLTPGTKKTMLGYIEQSGEFGITFANRMGTGFWVIFQDANNSNYISAMWCTIDSGVITTYEDDIIVIDGTVNISGSSLNIEALMLDGFANKCVVMYNYYVSLYGTGSKTAIIGIEFDSSSSFVYQIDSNTWWKFFGLDIADVPVILSGGNLDDNFNIWLNSYKVLKKYPSDTETSAVAYIRTKEFYIQEGVFQRWLVDFEGTNVDVETRVIKEVSGADVVETDLKENVAPNKFRGLPLGKMRGRKMSIRIIDASIIKALLLDVKGWGER